jgi:hypothetical protein
MAIELLHDIISGCSLLVLAAKYLLFIAPVQAICNANT